MDAISAEVYAEQAANREPAASHARRRPVAPMMLVVVVVVVVVMMMMMMVMMMISSSTIVGIISMADMFTMAGTDMLSAVHPSVPLMVLDLLIMSSVT